MHLRDAGHTLAEIVAKTGITRNTLYRHLPPRPEPLLTVAAPADDDPAGARAGRGRTAPVEQAAASAAPRRTPATGGAGDNATVAAAGVAPAVGGAAGQGAQDLLESVDWPPSYRPACPQCGRSISGLREQYRRPVGVRQLVVVALAVPCGCAVDEHAAELQSDAATPEPASASTSAL